MAIIQISKIQQRSGNIVDLPQLDEAEFGWATDVKKLYIGKTTPNENIEVLTSYSNISFSQINGSYGNLSIDGSNAANGQVLTFTGTDWTNRGGNIGGLINLGDVSNVKIEGGALSYVLETDGTGNLAWAPKSTIISFIENVTQANPGVVTTTEDNYFVNGSQVTITNVPGMTELNGNSYYLKILTSNTFELYDDSLLSVSTNTVSYGEFAYTSVSNTFAGTNKIKIGNTSLVNINDPVVFVGTTFGGIDANTTYYVTDIPDAGSPGNISVSVIEGGSNVVLTTDNGSANLYVSGGRAVSLVSGIGGSGSGVAGGTNTMVQFNNTNVLDGSPDLTFNFGVTPKILSLNGNANVGNLNATSTVVASILTSNVSTGTSPLVVTSTTRVANLNVTSANMADFAGNVTIATQSNITSLGTLTTLNVSARVNATGYTSNISTGTAPLTVSSTTRVANLNVDYANVSDFEVVTLQNTGTYFPTFVNASASGNRALGANANLAFDAATGNLQTNILFANGNVIGSNISASANITASENITSSANISGVNLIASQSMLATRFIQSPYPIVAPQGILNQGTGLITSLGFVAATGTGPTGVGVDPTGRFVYVTNGSASTVSQYSINQSTGLLTSITTPIASGSIPIGIAIDPSGKFVYVTNSSASTVSQYSINQSTGALTSIGSAIASGSGPEVLAVDPTGRFVYVVNNGDNTVSQYSINQTNGVLTSITTAISTGGSNNLGIAIDPTGRFVYVTNGGSASVTQYLINQTTGALSVIGSSVATGATPTDIVVDPSGRFVYIVNNGPDTIGQYSINQSTGVLTSITSAISAGINPNDIAVDPGGKYVYVTNAGSNSVSQFRINQVSGVLTNLGTTVSTGSIPSDIAVDPTGRFVYVTNVSSSTVSQYGTQNSSTGSLVVSGNLTVSNFISGNITTLTTGANVTTGNVTGNWTLTAGSRWNATYADLAEYYTSDMHYEPGTVIEFGGQYEVTLGTPNTNKVAGVVSTDPAFAMNAKCAGEHAVAIALQGRVPTKVIGNVNKGDMMVSAGNGYAMACSSPTIGSILGKSLENFNGTTGLIEIVVGRL